METNRDEDPKRSDSSCCPEQHRPKQIRAGRARKSRVCRVTADERLFAAVTSDSRLFAVTFVKNISAPVVSLFLSI
ncbi:hypothetical protein ROHU_008582 [Labeo rohita]|uniref:Uncharacterized protein n=1 Tax=Labeo rohita TaxID=84645 RepID=A0A498M5M8_LABRO|nr:hypothetical protein ROHU_008582 [Labeo rohita]